jgi:hypothetical protein
LGPKNLISTTSKFGKSAFILRKMSFSKSRNWVAQAVERHFTLKTPPCKSSGFDASLLSFPTTFAQLVNSSALSR